jgi:hypothetical protein
VASGTLVQHAHKKQAVVYSEMHCNAPRSLLELIMMMPVQQVNYGGFSNKSTNQLRANRDQECTNDFKQKQQTQMRNKTNTGKPPRKAAAKTCSGHCCKLPGERT